MKLFTKLLTASFILFGYTLFSQWTNIPNPKGVVGYITLPVANNKIIYIVNDYGPSPGSPKNAYAYMSNDLGQKNLIYSQHVDAWYTCNLIYVSSYNDSTIAFNQNVSYYGIAYSANGFKTHDYLSIGGTSIKSSFNTSRHLFVLQRTLYFNPDTLVFKRMSIGNPIPEDTSYLYGYDTNSEIDEKMRFINDSVGFILTKYASNTSKTVLLKTQNYGTNWTEINTDSINGITAYSFSSNSIGYITKTNGSICKTSDGGSSWSVLISPTTNTINCIKFSNDTLGYIGGDNGFLKKTLNGGASWINEISGTTENITNIYTFDTIAYFKTAQGSLFKNISNVNKQQNVVRSFNDFVIYPNPSQGIIYIDFIKDESGETSISINNLLGKEVYHLQNVSEELNFSEILNVSQLDNGVYVIKITNAGKSKIQKILIANK